MRSLDFLLLRKSLLLCAILCIAFWIRILSVDAIPDEHFTGIDPYLYYWQAQIISEHGQLPERDMHRWLPLGRDLGQTLNLYGYVGETQTQNASIQILSHAMQVRRTPTPRSTASAGFLFY
jgi:hypothetical protein